MAPTSPVSAILASARAGRPAPAASGGEMATAGGRSARRIRSVGCCSGGRSEKRMASCSFPCLETPYLELGEPELHRFRILRELARAELDQALPLCLKRQLSALLNPPFSRGWVEVEEEARELEPAPLPRTSDEGCQTSMLCASVSREPEGIREENGLSLPSLAVWAGARVAGETRASAAADATASRREMPPVGLSERERGNSSAAAATAAIVGRAEGERPSAHGERGAPSGIFL
eukprot:scaffold252372_cov26-Tisochrysis_lutea.AAC.4